MRNILNITSNLKENVYMILYGFVGFGKTSISDYVSLFHISCLTYSVQSSYWPPFFGGCVSCPQVPTFIEVIRRFRVYILLLECSFDLEPTFWYKSFCCTYFYVHNYFGYGGALSRHMILLSVCVLEACRHRCGSWVTDVRLRLGFNVTALTARMYFCFSMSCMIYMVKRTTKKNLG